jgi:hypothetical protein
MHCHDFARCTHCTGFIAAFPGHPPPPHTHTHTRLTPPIRPLDAAAPETAPVVGTCMICSESLPFAHVGLAHVHVP